MSALKYIIPFNKIDKEDTALVGGKGANLGEMVQAGFPIPDGFAINILAYENFLQDNDLEKHINYSLKTLDINDPSQLDIIAKTIQKKIRFGRISEDLVREIFSSYFKLSGRFKKACVAVRSSATAEDSPTTSFAGQQRTHLNVRGEANLIEAVKDCWASLFTPRSIFYRVQNNISHRKVKISVIIQKMVHSDSSGVIFTIDPVTNEKDRIIIEAVWGLGEMIVQGSVVPDRYLVQKETNAILSKQISVQNLMMTKVKDKTKIINVPARKADQQKISDEEIVKLAKIAEKIHHHYYFPQDIEWAKEGKNLYIVQTRPVTTIENISKKKKVENQVSEIHANNPILIGTGVSPGVGVGEVIIIKGTRDINRVKKGNVLVATMTSPDFVPAMKKASAIVTDEGGITSHAAIVSRELGIPCVVGTKKATKLLKKGFIVTVNGLTGMVYLGSKLKIDKKEIIPKQYPRVKTATKVYVNLAEKTRLKEIAKMNVDGVGLLRAEFMMADIGIHPKEVIKQKKQNDYIDQLAKDLKVFCQEFNPKPVVYRASDLKTNEYRLLKGGKVWEPEEPNPLLGFRGAFRYLSDPEVFNLELKAITQVRKKYQNLWLMIPFVRSPDELAAVRRVVAAEGLLASSTFKFWMMVEIPTNVILIQDYIDVGIDGISIGSNDLTMLILGTDRDNTEVARSFDERSPAVLWALKRVIKICNKNNVSSSICGQAPSIYDDLVEILTKQGITSISVNPDAIGRVRYVVSQSEKKLVVKK